MLVLLTYSRHGPYTLFTCPRWELNRVAIWVFFGGRAFRPQVVEDLLCVSFRQSDLRWKPGSTLPYHGWRYTLQRYVLKNGGRYSLPQLERYECSRSIVNSSKLFVVALRVKFFQRTRMTGVVSPTREELKLNVTLDWLVL